MNPRAFLDVADELAEGGHQGHWRSTVSRAYYAAFHAAAALLRHCGFRVPQAERAHAYLSHRLMNSGHPDLVAAGNSLEDLRQARNRADYDVALLFVHEEALDCLGSAAEILQLFEDARVHSPTCDRITQAIRVYEQLIQDVTWKAPPNSPSAN